MLSYKKTISYKNLSLILILILLLGVACLAQDKPSTNLSDSIDLSGEWRVLLRNSNGYKQLRFSIQEKDRRPRGKIRSYEFGEQDLDGRRDEDGTIQFWSKLIDPTGATSNSNFTCRLENDTLVGKGEYMEKPYELKATRVKPKNK